MKVKPATRENVYLSYEQYMDCLKFIIKILKCSEYISQISIFFSLPLYWRLRDLLSAKLPYLTIYYSILSLSYHLACVSCICEMLYLYGPTHFCQYIGTSLATITIYASN